MARTTLTIEGATRATLVGALLAMLGEAADRLAGALSAADRERSPESAHAAYGDLRRVGELLETLGWRADPAGAAHIEVERQLPIALEALRRELECMQELVADTQARGDARELALAMGRLRQTGEALRRLEADAQAASAATP